MKPEQRIVSRLLTMFGEPKTDDPIAYMNEFERAVAGYSAEVLELAGNQVIRKSRFWPRPAEIVEQADEIASRIAAEQSRRAPKPLEPDLPPPTLEQRGRAKQILENAKAAMLANVHRDVPAALPRVSRDAFEAMQRISPNRHLHVDQSLSRRITGERE